MLRVCFKYALSKFDEVAQVWPGFVRFTQVLSGYVRLVRFGQVEYERERFAEVG